MLKQAGDKIARYTTKEVKNMPFLFEKLDVYKLALEFSENIYNFTKRPKSRLSRILARTESEAGASQAIGSPRWSLGTSAK